MIEEKKKSTRWASGRIKISKQADPNRKYLCVIPTSDGEAFLGVLVYPDKMYGEFTGRQIIAKYLSRNWRKGELASTGAKRQSDSRNKPRYGNKRTQEDVDRVTRLGNERDDSAFLKHKHKLDELEGNKRGTKEYIKNLNRMKNKLKFDIGNQAYMPSEWTEETIRSGKSKKEVEEATESPEDENE
jgi:hypothetical protein